MKSVLAIFAFTVQIFCGYSAQAFDHGKVAPAMAPRHSGQVVSSDEVEAHFEMVPGKQFKLYIYPMDLNATAKIFSVSAALQATGDRKQAPLSVIGKEAHYEMSPGRKRGFAIYLSVTNTKTQKQDLLRFVF